MSATANYRTEPVAVPIRPDEQIDPETGWHAASADERTATAVTLYEDLDGNPTGIGAESFTARAVHYVPPGSPRWARLAAEELERQQFGG